MVALELEVLAKKFDRFGWERDRGTPAHDRLVTDWMDALENYPLDEIQAACAAEIRAHPHRMPNEGHIAERIVRERQRKAPRPVPQQEPEPNRISAERANEIVREAGFAPRKF